MQREKICYIVGAGDWYDYPITRRNGDLLIAVDGGYDTLSGMHLVPDYVIGDFDSISHSVEGENCIRLNPIKDDTDTLWAVSFAKKQGYHTIILLGVTGGARISHTVANIQILERFKDLAIFLVDREEVLFLLENDRIVFPAKCTGYLSVFSLAEESRGVTEKGLKYQLSGASLYRNFPIGVSNEFIGEVGEVSVENGTLLLAVEKDVLNYLLEEM